MAFITIPSIKIGDEITVDTLNTFINEVNAVPTAINEDNIRDEGIDRRNLATSAVQKISLTQGVYLYSSDAEHYYNNNIWTTVTQVDSTGAGSGHPIMVGRTSTITCEDYEWILVSCSFSFRTNVLTPILASSNIGGQEVHFKLIWDDVAQGVVTAYVDGTERRFNNFIALGTTGSQYHARTRYSCTIVAAIRPSDYGLGNHNVAVGLQAKVIEASGAASNAFVVIESVSMLARVIKR
tara:strand:+ start:1245 stop:1958 length:714 start_codon:yes stop_codon:yes gene_type:complete